MLSLSGVIESNGESALTRGVIGTIGLLETRRTGTAWILWDPGLLLAAAPGLAGHVLFRLWKNAPGFTRVFNPVCRSRAARRTSAVTASGR
jgi:hypothetical protein